MTSVPVLRVRDLHKTYRVGFLRRKVEAVRGIDFEVQAGEVFGLLGPNGAGKTTTIKMILGLVFPVRGTVELFGTSDCSARVKARLGYLPESPYVYQYLKPLEFLDLCGRLTGMSAQARRTRSDELVQRVGLAHALDRPIGKFSKGMMQRIGLAQALLHDPELLILDEPMSGLDPLGRKEVRDLVLEQKRAGKTILFTSHILSDVETLCDRVGILQRGLMSQYGTLRDLLHRHTQRPVEIELERVSDGLREILEAQGLTLRTAGESVLAVAPSTDAAQGAISKAIEAGARVASVTPSKDSLEDLFVRERAIGDDGPRAP